MAIARPAVMFAYDGQRKSTLAKLRDLVDVVVVPGTVATIHHTAVPNFLGRLHRDYAIDPRTPLFQFRDFGDGAVKASAKTLAAAYGEHFAACFASGGVTKMTDDEWRRAAAQWALYQGCYAPPGQLSFSPPTIVLPLYLMTDTRLGREWALTVDMLRETKAVAHDRPVWGVAALRSLDPLAPDVETLDVMLTTLSQQVDTVFVWLDGYLERNTRPLAVTGLAELAGRHGDLTLYSLYGGYLSLLRYQFGWAGTSSGIGYSDSRVAAALAESGSGSSPSRYYLPLLHAYTAPDVAESFIRRAGPIAECHCSTCLAHADGVAVRRLNGEQLAEHFVQARDAERRRVTSASLAELTADLRTAHKVAVSAGIKVPDSHLLAWASGLQDARC